MRATVRDAKAKLQRIDAARATVETSWENQLEQTHDTTTWSSKSSSESTRSWTSKTSPGPSKWDIVSGVRQPFDMRCQCCLERAMRHETESRARALTAARQALEDSKAAERLY
ncbi:hypothetical protein ABVK25_003063 [Lepraria finkii]|uniref:Uncharacterized protein n=1 Tax=Lepraria finkii TaxID=1340010 RepID=A0ABR4BFP1_9LECA